MLLPSVKSTYDPAAEVFKRVVLLFESNDVLNFLNITDPGNALTDDGASRGFPFEICLRAQFFALSLSSLYATFLHS